MPGQGKDIEESVKAETVTIPSSLSLVLDSKILSLPGVEKRRSRWMDTDAYFIGEREFVHFHRNDEVDVRLTSGFQRKYAIEIRNNPRVRFRRNPSQWVAIDYRTREDVDYAFRIMKLAAAANSLRGRKPE